MNILREETITVALSVREVVAALRKAHPDEFMFNRLAAAVSDPSLGALKMQVDRGALLVSLEATAKPADMVARRQSEPQPPSAA